MGEREAETEIRQLDEEVVMVSTWVWLTNRCPISRQKLLAEERTVNDEAVDTSLEPGTLQDGYQGELNILDG